MNMEAIRAIIRAHSDQFTFELPEDLVFYDILSQLPPKTLMRFKTVSQTWRTRISTDSSFIDAHQICQETKTAGPLHIAIARLNGGEETMMLLSEQTSKATEVEASYVLKGKGGLNTMDSCNGLVCMSLGWPRVVVLWNPATRQQRELPRPTTNLTSVFSDGGLGFGFDVTSNDFKVVQLSRTPSGEGSLMHAHVFARSGTAWRECKTSLRISEEIRWMHDAVAVEGVLYWAVLTESGQHIVSFDLRDEVLRLSHPPVDSDSSLALCKWNGSLAAYTQFYGVKKIMLASTYSGGVRHWNKILPVTIPERNFELPENFKLRTSNFDFPDDVIRMRRDYVESIASVF